MAKHVVSAQLLSLGKVHESVCAANEILSTRLRVHGQGTSTIWNWGQGYRWDLNRLAGEGRGGEEGSLSLAPLLP